jgi:CarD family transcriptional regulator
VRRGAARVSCAATIRDRGLTVQSILGTISSMKSPRKSTRTSARHAPTKYKTGQEIVYPLQGVGHIEKIEERPFRDKKLLYYIIYLEVSDMTVMVPVDKADELGIRAIVGKKESQKALRLIAEEYEPVLADWKLRYQMNLDLLKKGSIIDIANVVRALYHRSRIKELPILERKLYDSALKLLIDEISFSIEKSKEDVEQLVFARLKVNAK